MNKLFEEKNEINNELNKMKKFEELNKQLNHKIKKYEVLLYKMDLENQGYKDEIQKYQNQLSTVSGQTINFIPIYKIDLNTELESIEGNIDNIDKEENIETNNNKEENNETNNEENKKNINYEDSSEKYINTEDINYQINKEEKMNDEENNDNYERDNENNSKDNIEDIEELNNIK